MHANQRPPIPAWLIIIVTVAALAAALLVPRFRKPGELPVYTKAATRLMNREPIYLATDRKAFTYPPFFTLPFVPLALLPESWQRPAWWLCNVWLVGVVAYLITWLAWEVAVRGVRRGGPPIWMNVLLISALSAKFMLLPLAWESHDLMVLVLVLACGIAWARQMNIATGIAAGLAAACKATPLLILPFLLWQRRFFASAALTVTLIGATLLPDLLCPQQQSTWRFREWNSQFVAKVNVGSAPAAAGAWQKWNSLNQSLAGTAHRLFSPRPLNPNKQAASVAPTSWQLRGITLMASALTLVWLAWVLRRPSQGDESKQYETFRCLGQSGAILCGMLLLSPMSSTYHFCGLVVPISFCATYWMYCERSVTVGTALLIHFVVTLVSAQDIVGPRLADLLLEYGVMTFEAVLLLVTSGYILAWRMPRLTAQRADEQAFVIRPPVGVVSTQRRAA